MKTKNHNFPVGNGRHFVAPMPVECPHCAHAVSPRVIKISGYAPDQALHGVVVTFQPDCCEKVFYGLYQVKNQEGELLALYPIAPAPELPEAIKALSPRFIEMYKQCYYAEQNGFIDLAGSGYRNAIEILVKDFAINELGVEKSDVGKAKLATAIKKYMPSFDMKSSADVVRILGNDYTHYTTNFDDVSFQIFKRYLHIFITSVETQLLIKHPVTDPSRKSDGQ
jgi:hypothetical protein